MFVVCLFILVFAELSVLFVCLFVLCCVVGFIFAFSFIDQTVGKSLDSKRLTVVTQANGRILFYLFIYCILILALDCKLENSDVFSHTLSTRDFSCVLSGSFKTLKAQETNNRRKTFTLTFLSSV